MPSIIPPFSLRISETLMEKLRIIAKNNKRSINKEIEFLIEKYISEYEKQFGPLKLE